MKEFECRRFCGVEDLQLDEGWDRVNAPYDARAAEIFAKREYLANPFSEITVETRGPTGVTFRWKVFVDRDPTFHAVSA